MQKSSNLTGTIIDKDDFITKTNQLFGDKITGQNGIVSNIDYNSTSYREMEVNGITHKFYYTKSFNSNGKENGGLISLILPDKKVFNCFVESINNADGSFTNYYSDFSENKFGEVSVSKGQITKSTLGLPEVVLNTQTFPRRSWWACTTDCIGDAHIACYQNTECQVLLVATNLGGKGAATASISVACGASCLANSNLDMLPQY